MDAGSASVRIALGAIRLYTFSELSKACCHIFATVEDELRSATMNLSKIINTKFLKEFSLIDFFVGLSVNGFH